MIRFKRKWLMLVLLALLHLNAAALPDSIGIKQSVLYDLSHIKGKQDFESKLAILQQVTAQQYYFYEEKLDAVQISDSFLLSANQLQKWARNKGDNKQQIQARIEIFLYHFYAQEFGLARSYGLSLVKNKEALELPQITMVIKVLAKVYKERGEYYEILSFLPYGVKLLKKYGDTINSEYSRFNIIMGLAHYNTQNYKQALFYFDRGYKVYPNKLLKSSMLNNMGLCYLKLEKMDSARTLFQRSLNLLDSNRTLILKQELGKPLHKTKEQTANNVDFFGSVIESNLADIDLFYDRFENAQVKYQSELVYAQRMKNYRIAVMSYLKLAKLNYKQRKSKQALLYLDSTFNMLTSKRLGRSDVMIEAFLLKGKCLLDLGARKEAEVYFKMSKSFADSLALHKIQETFENGVSVYEFQQQENELIQSEQERFIQGVVSKYQKWGLFFLALIAFGLFFFYKKANSDKKVIQQRKAEADKSLKEKEMLLKEIHHRVKNNLQVVSGILAFHAEKGGSAEFSGLISESQNHIQSMSLVHEMLYQQNKNIAAISLQEYLTQLGQNLLYTDPEKLISLKIETNGATLPVKKAIPLGLLITELITNSIKHAFIGHEGMIIIEVLVKRHNRIQFIYADNGVGLKQDLNEKESKTMGFILIDMLVAELNAGLERSSEDGLKYEITFDASADE